MFHDEWFGQLKELRSKEMGPAPRGLGTREELDWSIQLYSDDGNVLDIPKRELNYKFMVAEWLWVMFGHSDVASIAQYNGVMRRFSDDGVFLTGAYGPHVSGGVHSVIAKLKADPMTRQAVIQIPRPQSKTKDEPCTLSLQFLNRDEQLHCIVSMRSSDIWLGVPYDVFTFTQIQNCIAGALGLDRGFFSLHAGSSHLYNLDDNKAAKVIESRIGRPAWTLLSPPLTGLPPQWLDRVFMEPKLSSIPEINRNNHLNPWTLYAKALCSDTWLEAREFIVLAHNMELSRF